MSDKFVMSVRQAAELDHAFERNGWIPAQVKELSQGDTLAQVRRVLLGHASIVPVGHVITCTCGSFLHRFGSGWSEEEHHNCGTMQLEERSDGQLYINGKKVERHLSPNQKGDKIVQGHKLHKELSDQLILCACVLDYLLKHPELIPEDWKNGYTFFWGTIFRDSDGDLSVAYLFWLGRRWSRSYDWLDGDWGSLGPAARLASE